MECAAVNADFTCPVTQDILYRIMSCGDKYETYANVKEADEIPILPPGKLIDKVLIAYYCVVSDLLSVILVRYQAVPPIPKFLSPP